MHQRYCPVVKNLIDEAFDIKEENLTCSYKNENYNEDLDNYMNNSVPYI